MNDYPHLEIEFSLCEYADKLLSKIERISIRASIKLNVQLIKKAIFVAKKYHEGQVRQSGEPYYSHPLEVASMVSDYLPDTSAIIISILHDTLEDTELTYEIIAEQFGNIIADGVQDLTRIKPSGKITSADMLKHLWKEKKYNLALIKLFDRLHNMETIFAKSPEKQKKIVTETLQYFLVVGEALGLPFLVDVLYERCYQANIRLGIIEPEGLIFSEGLPRFFEHSPISENSLR
jgi:guanosine-3',5'-bis(diphosphate) 3'-pyrophosphohydrolase